MNICASSDSFGAYSENCEGIYAAGGTVEECKKDVEVAIALIKKNLPEERWPEQIKGDYTLVWHYDIQSLFALLWRFVISLRIGETYRHTSKTTVVIYARTFKPRIQQKQRIEKALHSFANELADVSVL